MPTAIAVVDLLGDQWGTPELIKVLVPEVANDESLVEQLARQQRVALTPRSAKAMWRTILDADVRGALSLVQAPTLVLHATANEIVPLSHGRYLAQQVAGARLIERPGRSIGFTPASYADTPRQIEQFLTGKSAPAPVDRVLTTILFTDIVGSTSRLADLGDKAWRQVLDGHYRVMRQQLQIHHGREVNTTGDGLVASFDGPARAIRCAQAMVHAVQPLGIEVRTGLHCGECEVRGDDLTGLAVHIAARVSALAEPSQVLVSSTVKDLVSGSGLQFDDFGDHDLKGVPGPWRLLALRD
jgi:class 3 adenylate cyclase